MLHLARKEGGGGTIYDLRVRAASPVVPLASGRLRVRVEDQRGEARTGGGTGKVDGKRGLTRSALLADDRYGLHVAPARVRV